MNTETERLLVEFEESVYHAIKAAFELTRQEIDITTLADAIASRDETAIAAAMSIAATNLQQNADNELADLFAGLFEAVAIIAVTAIGHPSQTPDRLAEVARDNLRFRLARELAVISTQSALRSINLMRANAESPRAIASHLARNIGLSAGQQKSLDTFRYLLKRGQRRNTGYIPPSQLRRLNAAQRSILRNAVKGELTDDDVQRLTNKQRRILENHRALVTARTASVTLANAAQQASWESLDRQRLIDGYKRFWVTARDERVRTTHRAVPVLNPAGVGLQQPFQTPLGPAHSPPLEVNCRCHIELRKPSP